MEEGKRWGPKHERDFCHGGKPAREKEPDDGCAYIWPVWGILHEYYEVPALVEGGMPAPTHWDIRDWRYALWVKRVVQDLRESESPDTEPRSERE